MFHYQPPIMNVKDAFVVTCKDIQSTAVNVELIKSMQKLVYLMSVDKARKSNNKIVIAFRNKANLSLEI